jgi:hypothetical protein
MFFFEEKKCKGQFFFFFISQHLLQPQRPQMSNISPNNFPNENTDFAQLYNVQKTRFLIPSISLSESLNETEQDKIWVLAEKQIVETNDFEDFDFSRESTAMNDDLSLVSDFTVINRDFPLNDATMIENEFEAYDFQGFFNDDFDTEMGRFSSDFQEIGQKYHLIGTLNEERQNISQEEEEMSAIDEAQNDGIEVIMVHVPAGIAAYEVILKILQTMKKYELFFFSWNYDFQLQVEFPIFNPISNFQSNIQFPG